MIKKTFKFIAIIFLLLILAAIALPYLFKDKIVAAVKTEINNNVNAKVEFEDVSLSLFKSFPDFNFGLEELSIIGIDKFEGNKLLNAENIEFSIDLMSVINEDQPIEINSVSLVKPEINITVLSNGVANYDIMKPSTSDNTSEETYNFLIQLEKYNITDGNFVYDDKSSNTYAEIQKLNHEGKGQFTQDIFDINTVTDIGSLTAKSGGVSYLRNAKANIDLVVTADIPNNRYTIKDNTISINTLKLNTEGYAQVNQKDIDIDFKFNAPQNNFKNLLSMIPSAYTTDFEGVKASGSYTLDGKIKGKYNVDNGALPSFLINLKVDNADFKYPDLPLGISDINTTVKINSPSSDLDMMKVDIPNFSMLLGNNPISAKLLLETILSDPAIDTEINGTLDLSELAQAFPIEGLTKMSGIITSDIKMKANMSSIDDQDYENIEMNGDLKIKDAVIQSEDVPSIKVSTMGLGFSPKNIKLYELEVQAGKSDISVNGTVDNILAYFSPDKTMKGKVTMRSTLLDANEWISTESSEETTPVNDSEETELFDRFDFTLVGNFDQILYDIYDLKNTNFDGNITSNEADIQLFQTKVGESDFDIKGKVTNIFDYLFDNQTLKGDIYLTSKYINANEFMVETPDTEVENLEVLPVPEHIDISINTDIDELLYTNIPIKSIKGKILVENEMAIIKDGTAKTLGGDITMNGSYNTQDIEKPSFDMAYKINSLNYQNAFEKLNTFQALSPIGKFIDGNFNTTFNMSGILGQDMIPDLKTLSAKGILETLNGSLKSFKPVEEFANKLNINSLKSINLKNTKNWFELNNGEVSIKDFDVKTNGIEMTIGGKHGLDTEMNYNIVAKIPRTLLQNNKVGQAADKGISFLQNEANKLGISIDQGDFINVNAVITGSMTNPKIKINLLGSGGKSQLLDDIVEKVKIEAVDKVSTVIEDKTGIDVKNIEEEVEVIKEDLSAKADAEIAELMKKTENAIEKIETEANKRANQTKEEAQKLSNTAKTEGYKQADALVEKAGSNIFKKKAAEIAAKKLRSETDKKAEDIIIQGDKTAQSIIDTAEEQSSKLQAEADKQAAEIRKKYE